MYDFYDNKEPLKEVTREDLLQDLYILRDSVRMSKLVKENRYDGCMDIF
jgi:hypothetical protein